MDSTKIPRDTRKKKSKDYNIVYGSQNNRVIPRSQISKRSNGLSKKISFDQSDYKRRSIERMESFVDEIKSRHQDLEYRESPFKYYM
jgi:hypothetical protein